MNDEILFSEKQRFRQWWIWVVLLGLNALLISIISIQIFGEKPSGDDSVSYTELSIITVLMVLFTIFFYIHCLETIVKKDGIYVRFYPIHRKFKYYGWDTINKCYIRKYSPLIEFGGWGIRTGKGGKVTAYNVSGNMGMQLEFTDNNKLLIGTNKPDELAEVLKKIGKLVE
ncbi:MAG: hypothetical protein KatS3mg027_1373 [Bacteroidia bacterium]|nr:MAG: hypothetical protein KatS3mg027_1373 [Bacteroidia bacterium]